MHLTWKFVGIVGALGLVAGIIASLLGLGAGIIVVPVLSYMWDRACATPQKLAQGTALALMLPMAIAGCRRDQFWRRARQLAPRPAHRDLFARRLRGRRRPAAAACARNQLPGRHLPRELGDCGGDVGHGGNRGCVARGAARQCVADVDTALCLRHGAADHRYCDDGMAHGGIPSVHGRADTVVVMVLRSLAFRLCPNLVYARLWR